MEFLHPFLRRHFEGIQFNWWRRGMSAVSLEANFICDSLKSKFILLLFASAAKWTIEVKKPTFC